MNVLIGKYVSTHGIKGEIRIKSNFQYKERIFKLGNKLIINNQEYEVTSYRPHKGYDMVTFKGIDNINQIISLKGSLVYIDKSLLNLNSDEYLDSDLINMDIIINNKLMGRVSSIRYLTETKKLLVVDSKYVPFELIKKIDLKNKKIEIEEVSGLL